MKYLLMYLWRVIFWFIFVAVVVWSLLVIIKFSNLLPDSTFIHIIAVIFGTALWLAISYLSSYLLFKIDDFFEKKASLDKIIREKHQILIIYVTMSLLALVVSIYFFIDWLEVMNDTFNRRTEDYFHALVPLFFLFISISAAVEGWKNYKDNTVSLTKVNQILEDYGKYIELNPDMTIRDISVLPHSKDDILAALQIGIIYANNEKKIDALKTSAIFLSQFQKDIGSKPITPFGIEPSELMKHTLEEQADIITNSEFDKYEQFRKITEIDLSDNILPRIYLAEKLREDKLKGKV